MAHPLVMGLGPSQFRHWLSVQKQPVQEHSHLRHTRCFSSVRVRLVDARDGHCLLCQIQRHPVVLQMLSPAVTGIACTGSGVADVFPMMSYLNPLEPPFEFSVHTVISICPPLVAQHLAHMQGMKTMQPTLNRPDNCCSSGVPHRSTKEMESSTLICLRIGWLDLGSV